MGGGGEIPPHNKQQQQQEQPKPTTAATTTTTATQMKNILSHNPSLLSSSLSFPFEMLLLFKYPFENPNFCHMFRPRNVIWLSTLGYVRETSNTTKPKTRTTLVQNPSLSLAFQNLYCFCLSNMQCKNPSCFQCLTWITFPCFMRFLEKVSYLD